MKTRIVHNKLLGGWYVVTGPHQSPLGGRFNSKAEAQAWLDSRAAARDEARPRYKRTSAITFTAENPAGDTKGRLSPGDRVSAVVYGEPKVGTVIEHRGGIVWVHWDGAARKAWMHRESLTANPRRGMMRGGVWDSDALTPGLPASPNGISGDRWEVTLPGGALVAEFSALHVDFATAKRLSKSVATSIRSSIHLTLQKPRVRTNPTLVHHGKAGAAAWHLTTEGPDYKPLADLYGFGQPQAAKIGRLVANMIGAPVTLHDNSKLPIMFKGHRRMGIGGPVDNHNPRLRARRTSNPKGPNLSPGTRVAAVVYGEPREGVVLEQRSGGIVWVRWDGATRKTWMNRESLTVLESNPKGHFSIREVQDRAGGMHNREVTVFEVYDNRDGHVVMRTYNKRDATTERAYRNKFGENPKGRITANPKGPERPDDSIVRELWLEEARNATLSKDPARLEHARQTLKTLRGKENPRAAKIAAFREWQSPMDTPLREEYRVRKLKTPADYDAARAAIGPYAEMAGPFALERRMLKDGTQSEPWQFMGFYMSKHKALADIHLHKDGVALDPLLVKIQDQRRIAAEADAQQRGEAQSRSMIEALAAVKRRESGQAFDRMLASPKYAHLAQGWNAAVIRLKPRRDEFAKDPEFMQFYAAVIDAVTIPAKAKAVRLFLARYAPASNPRRRPSTLERAKATARRWNEFEPTTAQRMEGPPSRLPRTMVRLGDLHSVTYSSRKYAGGPDNPTGKTILYEHRTKRPRPVLATDPGGRFVYIVGGKMKPTADGLVN